MTSLEPVSGATAQLPYTNVFIATLSFAAVAVVFAPFARLGKLGVASTATELSLPLVDTSVKSLSLDGGVNLDGIPQENDSVKQENNSKRIFIQPRGSSLLGTSIHNEWQRTSKGAASFQLPRIVGSRPSADASGFDPCLGNSDDEDTKLQRISTAAMTERVIWLVCEDCGASKRIVEPVGDPERYFYDSDEGRDSGYQNNTLNRVITPLTPSSKYSSVYHEQEASVAEVGVVVDCRRFALVNGPDPMATLDEEHEG